MTLKIQNRAQSKKKSSIFDRLITSLNRITHRRKKITDKDAIAVCRRSVLFDSDWYLIQYPEVRAAKMDPVIHYVQQGVFEGCDPGPRFSVKKYLSNHSELADTGLNPLVHFEMEQKDSYQKWIVLYDTLFDKEREEILRSFNNFKNKPLISVIMPVYNVSMQWLQLAIDSVLSQLYPNWELCIADDASTEPHIKEILRYYEQKDKRIKVVYRTENGHISAASNSALQLATGEFIALLDHDDELAEHALFKVVEWINNHPHACLVYSDEDKIDSNGKRQEPYFKSDWNPDLIYGQNFISHFGVYSRKIVNEIGGFREGYEGSQDYDLALRVIEKINAEQILHIPHILYHWRKIPGSLALHGKAKNYAYDAARKAIQSHLERVGMSNVQVVANPYLPDFHRVIYPLPVLLPLVSIIIPTKDKVGLLKQCVQSVLNKTQYSNYELIIIDNQSEEKATFDYFEQLKNNSKIQIIPYNIPFNYSKINNYAVNVHAKGSMLLFLNNDTEVISSHWLSEMVSHAQRPEIGAVGAKLYYPDETIQHAGVICGLGSSKGTGVAGHIYNRMDKKNHGYLGKAQLTQNFLAVTAACLLMRREVFQEVGGFEESNLVVAFNDVDLCLRVYKKGYRILWTPFAELYHHESATRKSNRTAKDKVQSRKEICYMLENWNELLQNDPFHNPNLTLALSDCSLAFPPRKHILDAK